MKSHVVKVRATPDTGCTRTVISTAIAERLNLTPKTDQNILLVTANGEEMQVDGHAKLQASSRGTTVVTDAIISPHMNEDMLISWSDLIALNRIPAGFPNTIIRTDRELVRALRQESKQTHCVNQSTHISCTQTGAGNSNPPKDSIRALRTGSKMEESAGNSNTPDAHGGEAGNSARMHKSPPTIEEAANSNHMGKRSQEAINLTNSLLKDYEDVLSDELSPTPMKTEQPMHITLKSDYKPFKTLSARRVALRTKKKPPKRLKN